MKTPLWKCSRTERSEIKQLASNLNKKIINLSAETSKLSNQLDYARHELETAKKRLKELELQYGEII